MTDLNDIAVCLIVLDTRESIPGRNFCLNVSMCVYESRVMSGESVMSYSMF